MSISILLNKCLDDPMAFFTAAVALVMLFNLGVNIWLALITRLSILSYRPYIGIETVNHNTSKYENDDILNISLVIKNFGKIPAKNIKINARKIICGQIRPMVRLNDPQNTILFPGVRSIQIVVLSPEEYSKVFVENATLNLLIQITYCGVKHKRKRKYKTCHTLEYNNIADCFTDAGGNWR